ncbi:MAG: hypothetical protein AAGJ29_12955 [Pseudomonadota bacterium]
MTVDRKISYALVFAIVVQAAGALTWAGASSQRLQSIEQEVQLRRGLIERLARLEAEVEGMRMQLDRIERKIDVD